MNPGKLSDAVRVYDPLENLRHAAEIHRPKLQPAQMPALTRQIILKLTSSLQPMEVRSNMRQSAASGLVHAATPRAASCAPATAQPAKRTLNARAGSPSMGDACRRLCSDEGFESRAVHEALDLCLSCKACKTECPVQVDMAADKSEFLAQRLQGPRCIRSTTTSSASLTSLAHWGSLVPCSHQRTCLSAGSPALSVKRIAGVAQERQLPRLARKSYHESAWHRRSRICVQTLWRSAQSHLGPRSGIGRTAESVLLWPDTWNNYYHPHTLTAAESLLTQAGFQGGDSGRPHLLRPSALRLRPA